MIGTTVDCSAQVIDDHSDIPCRIFFKSKNWINIDARGKMNVNSWFF